MCRGVDFGPCVAEGCDTPIRCQDTGGFCDAHDPYNINFCECVGDCVCPPPEPRPYVNEAKRLRYDIGRLERSIPSMEIALQKNTAALEAARGRLAEKRFRLRVEFWGDV